MKNKETPRWYEITEFEPEQGLPCEYEITVLCRGWYCSSEEQGPNFKGAQNMAPSARIKRWRRWENAPSYEESLETVKQQLSASNKQDKLLNVEDKEI